MKSRKQMSFALLCGTAAAYQITRTPISRLYGSPPQMVQMGTRCVRAPLRPLESTALTPTLDFFRSTLDAPIASVEGTHTFSNTW